MTRVLIILGTVSPGVFSKVVHLVSFANNNNKSILTPMSDYTRSPHTWVILSTILPLLTIDMVKLRWIMKVLCTIEEMRQFSRQFSHVLSVFWALMSPCVGWCWSLQQWWWGRSRYTQMWHRVMTSRRPRDTSQIVSHYLSRNYYKL